MPIPQAGRTTQYVTDIKGGFIYTINTIVEVIQQSPDEFQSQIDQKRQYIAEITQTVVDETDLVQTLTEQVNTFNSAVVSAQNVVLNS